MLYLFAGHRRAFAIAAVAVALASCNTRAFFREGNANSVEVGYFGDVETATPAMKSSPFGAPGTEIAPRNRAGCDPLAAMRPSRSSS